MTRPTILPPGSYFIKNDGTGQFIGQVKSALLGTKPIQSISEQPSLAWEIDQLDNGNYTIKVNGLPVVAIKSNLSVLINPTAHLEWRIVPRNTLNSGYLAAYTIEQIQQDDEATEIQAWALTAAELGSQVSIRPLVATEPPSYPKEQLWLFSLP